MLLRSHKPGQRTSTVITQGPGWVSHRLLLQSDGLLYSVHLTTVQAGTELTMQYLNHIETVYCISGQGWITDHKTRIRHPLTAGSLYVLDQHDHHTLHAHTQMQGLCIFTPPCTGKETHDEHGSYPAAPH